MVSCQCGAQYPDGTKFCTKCGSALSSNFPNNNNNFQNTNANFQNNNVNYQNTQPQMGPMAPNTGMGQKNNLPTISKNNLNFIGIGTGALLLIATFLPYIQANVFGESLSQSLIKGGDGKIFIVIAIAAIVISILGKDKILLGIGGASCALSIWEIIDFSRVVNEYGVGDYVNRGIGFYLMIIASIGIVISAPVWKAIKKNQSR